MPAETTTTGEFEAGRDAVDTLETVAAAVRRADESLVMLAGVQIASTQSARNALQAARLSVLERLLEDVRGPVGVPAPVPPGQMSLDGDA